MGCDGGTIPRRDELVRTKKKPEQKDKNAETVAKWKHCAISQDPLHKPIVACELGKLYNKEAVLEHLLNKDGSTTEVAGHIKKLSDIKELSLTEKVGFEAKNSHKGDEYVDFNDSRYICPVTGIEMNGRQRFYFIWKCGCVLSERAIKEVKSETCHKCGKPLEENDVIILNGSDEEMEILHSKMIERRRLAKLEKKKKKSETSVGPEAKKIKVEPSDFSDNSSSNSGASVNGISLDDKNQSIFTSTMKIKCEPSAASVSTPNTNSTKPTISVRKIKSEPGPSSSNIPSKKQVNGKKVESAPNDKHADLPEKAKKTYSIAKDPSASEAYKSLFTSHSTAIRQDKAHWVTHNPLYY